MRVLCSPVLVIMLFGTAGNLHSQVQDDPHSADTSRSPSFMWINLGLGGANTEQFVGNLSISHESRIGTISVRLLAGAFPFVVYPLIPRQYFPRDLIELSGLYGVSLRPSIFHVSASAGLGVVWFNRMDSNNEQFAATLGIPFEAQALITPIPVFGIGLTGFANVNAISSYYGLALCVRLGKLR